MRDFDLKSLRKKQKEYSSFFREIEVKKAENFAGVDCHYKSEKIICCAVLIGIHGEIIEESITEGKTFFPYIPTFLAFREGPWMVNSIRKLKTVPDLIFVDGNGRLHPLGAGLAVYVGVKLNIPTIGFSKNPMKGYPKECSFNGEKFLKNGVAICRKGWKKPVFISSGNLITLRKSLEFYNLFSPTKIPIPIRLAHQRARLLINEH